MPSLWVPGPFARSWIIESSMTTLAQERRQRMSRALSRKLSGKAVSFTEEGSALVEGDGADGVAEDDDVVIEDLPMPARRSLTTRSFSVRTSDGSSAGGGSAGGGAGHAAPALPPNWEAHEDEQGNIFFYNTLTEEVRWEAP